MSLDDFLAWLMIYCVSGSLLNDWYIWIDRDFWYSGDVNSDSVIFLDLA